MRKPTLFLTCFYLFLAWTAPAPSLAGAGLNVGDDLVEVAPDQTHVLITADFLLSNDEPNTTVFAYGRPLHGVLEGQGVDVEYVPGVEFWTLGSDSFTYTITNGATVASATIFLVATRFGEVRFVESFDPGTRSEVSSMSSPAPVLIPEAAIDGHGMRCDQPGQYVELTMPDLDGCGGAGETDSGSTEIPVVPPPGGQLPLGSPTTFVEVSSATAVDAEIIVRAKDNQQGQRVIQAEMGNDRTDWLPVPDGAESIYLDWWRGDDGAGLLLRVSGVAAGRIDGLASYTDGLTEIRIGRPDSSQQAVATFDFDNVSVGWDVDDCDDTEPVVTLDQADNFELGNLDDWDNSEITPVTVTMDAAIDGSYGVEVPASICFLTDQSPAASRVYNARFAIDVRPLAINEFGSVTIFAGLASQASHWIELRLEADRGVPKLTAVYVKNTGLVETASATLANGVHLIELLWRVAPNANRDDGRLALWLDGALVGEVNGLANHDDIVEEVRLGTVATTFYSSGSFHIDNFLAWH